MTPRLLLTVAAIYLALVGLGLLLAPTVTVLGLDAATAPVVIAQLRAMSDVFIAVAVIDWVARNAEPSKARDAIFLGNAVGFSLSVVLGAGVSWIGGQVMSWIFTALSLCCAVGFIVVSRTHRWAAA